jgi:imidazolonepropionase-like amidohydrolase
MRSPETTMTRFICFLSLALVAACGDSSEPTAPVAEPASAPLPGEGAIAFTGANLWSGTGAAALRNANLVVRDGRIESVGTGAVPPGADIVDLEGAWVIPVTTVLSLGGAPRNSFGIRSAENSASLVRARLLLAGEVVFSQDPAEAAAMTQANIDAGVDWIKLRVDDNLGAVEKMSRDALSAAMEVAKAEGVPVATHIFYMDDATMMLGMGTSLIAHSVRDQQVSDEFVQTMLDSGVCYVPTLVREVSTFVYGERPSFFDDPFFLEAAKQSQMDRVSDPEFMERIATSPTAAVYREALKQAQDNLRIMIGAGVPVAFGTDSGPAGRFPGYFEHMELDLMSEAGLTAREILLTATSVAASCLQLDDVGTLEAGKWADFVVIEQNPLADISALHSIKNVFVAGNAVAH